MNREQDQHGTGQDSGHSLENVGMATGTTSGDILTDLISMKDAKFHTAGEPTGSANPDAQANIL